MMEIAKEAANRWGDNIISLRSMILRERRGEVSEAQFNKTFDLPEDWGWFAGQLSQPSAPKAMLRALFELPPGPRLAPRGIPFVCSILLPTSFGLCCCGLFWKLVFFRL